MEASITFIHTPTLSERARGITYPSAPDVIAKARKSLTDLSVVLIENQYQTFQPRVLAAYGTQVCEVLQEVLDTLEDYLDPKTVRSDFAQEPDEYLRLADKHAPICATDGTDSNSQTTTQTDGCDCA